MLVPTVSKLEKLRQEEHTLEQAAWASHGALPIFTQQKSV